MSKEAEDFFRQKTIENAKRPRMKKFLALVNREEEAKIMQEYTDKQLLLHSVIPRRLTAENGAKALLMGEFFEYIEVNNEEYCGCGECNYCINVQDEDASETILQKVPVSWDTIKEIYLTIVDHYGA